MNVLLIILLLLLSPHLTLSQSYLQWERLSHLTPLSCGATTFSDRLLPHPEYVGSRRYSSNSLGYIWPYIYTFGGITVPVDGLACSLWRFDMSLSTSEWGNAHWELVGDGMTFFDNCNGDVDAMGRGHPGGRYGNNLVTVANSSLYVFGGYGYSTVAVDGPGFLNDLWEFRPGDDPLLGQMETWFFHECGYPESHQWIDVVDGSSFVGGRFLAALWIQESTNDLFLWGGVGVSQISGLRMWRFYESIQRWSPMTLAAGIEENHRQAHWGMGDVFYYQCKTKVFMFNSTAPAPFLFVELVDHGSSADWETDGTGYPSERNGATGASVGGNGAGETYGFVFGGEETEGSPAEAMMDLWAYDVTSDLYYWIDIFMSDQVGFLTPYCLSGDISVPGTRVSASSLAISDEFDEIWFYVFGGHASTMYFGDVWRIKLTCDGVMAFNASVCGGHGLCSDVGCVYMCYGQYGRAGCNDNGDCIAWDVCECDEDRYIDAECGIPKQCDSTPFDDPSVCNGNGECVGVDDCECFSDEFGPTFYGAFCDIHRMCWDISFNDTETVCFGHGSCVDTNVCGECVDGWLGPNCTIRGTCDGIPFDGDYDLVCSGHGECLGADVCVCRQNYTGQFCSVPFMCFDYLANDTDNVCRGRGDCVETDMCVCHGILQYSGVECDIPYCFGLLATQSGVCDDRGDCQDDRTCACTSPNVYGAECQELITIATYDKTVSRIEVEYVVPWSSVSLGFQGRFDCRLILADASASSLPSSDEVGDVSVCYFEHGSGFTTFLVVDIGSTKHGFSSDDRLFVVPVTADWQVAECEMTRSKTSPFSLFSGLHPGWIGMIVGVFCLAVAAVGVTLIIGLSVYCSARRRVVKQSGELDKFSALENIDLILAEQEALKASGQGVLAGLHVNRSLFSIDYEDLEVRARIGEGGSDAIVFRATWQGVDVAFKCFKTGTLMTSQERFDEFEREVSILANVHHPYILTFYGATLKEPRVGIVMEFCENGDVKTFLKKRVEAENAYPLDQRLRLLYEIAQPLEYLHSHDIIHRDLKPENVLLTASEECRVMDFGLSKMVERASQKKTARVGTSYYMAPEVVRGDDYGSACDVFSFGILMLELLTDNFDPYGADVTSFNIEFKVAHNPNYRPTIPETIHPQYSGLIQRCWRHDVEARPSFEDVIRILGVEEILPVVGVDDVEFRQGKEGIEDLTQIRDVWAEQVRELTSEFDSLQTRLHDLGGSVGDQGQY